MESKNKKTTKKVDKTKTDLKKNKNDIIEKPNAEKVVKSSKKGSFYISFNVRFSMILILFVFCFITSFQLIRMSFSIIKERTIDYQEKSDIDYKVYLKPNEFYEEEYLEKNMVYVSTLIKNIETNFDYQFSISEKSTIEFDYSISGKLLITDANGTKTFFEKNYTLLENKSKTIENETNANINETIKIDYGYYNDIANRYRQQYGINSKSHFVVTLSVKKINDNKSVELNNDNDMSISIPLTQNEVNIKIDSNELNNNEYIISKAMLKTNNIVYIILGLLNIVISMILFVRIIKYMFILMPKKNRYDRMLAKILKEYDRFIVETTTPPDEEHLNVVKVYKFTELLDVRDNLNQPIKYYNITKHQKCIFYINYDNEIYIYILKSVDLDNDN